MPANNPIEWHFGREIVRKGLHLAALVIPLGMLHLDKAPALFLLGLITVAALSLDVLRARFVPVAAVIHQWFGSLMRPDEIPRRGNFPVVNGSTWTLVSAFLLLLVFPARIAAFAMVVFLLGDAAAALAGRKFGRRPWGFGRCTVEGSAAFLAVSLPVAFLMPGILIWTGVTAAIFAAATEMLPGPFNDNLQVPVVTAVVVALLELAAARWFF